MLRADYYFLNLNSMQHKVQKTFQGKSGNLPGKVRTLSPESLQVLHEKFFGNDKVLQLCTQPDVVGRSSYFQGESFLRKYELLFTFVPDLKFCPGYL